MAAHRTTGSRGRNESLRAVRVGMWRDVATFTRLKACKLCDQLSSALTESVAQTLDFKLALQLLSHLILWPALSQGQRCRGSGWPFEKQKPSIRVANEQLNLLGLLHVAPCCCR